MRSCSICTGIAVCIQASVFLAEPARAQFEEMGRRVPGSANVMVLVNIEKLLDSPLARQGGWRDDAVKRLAAGLTSVPANANHLIIAAHLDLRSMRPAWEMALMQMDGAPPLDAIANFYGGVTDTVAGNFALRLPDDTYVVHFSDQLLGGFYPGDRQIVSRWLRGSHGNLPACLKEAVGYADAGATVIMAIDMTDVASIGDIREGMAALEEELPENPKLDLLELARLLGDVQSLMLGINFDERMFAKIKLEFGRDASMIAGIAKPLLLAILAERGLMLEECEDWKVEVEGKRVMFGGYLTDSGLTRLSSLVQPPTSGLSSLKELRRAEEALRDAAAKAVPGKKPSASGTTPREALSTPEAGQHDTPHTEKTEQVNPLPPPESASVQAPLPPDPSRSYLMPTAEATREYFRSTGGLLADLRRSKRRARTIPHVGRWYEIYARKIDRLPLLRVDDQMLGYGSHVGNRLREASMAIKQAGIQTRAQQVAAVNRGARTTVSGSYSPRYSSGVIHGRAELARPFTLREQSAVRRQVRTQNRAAAAMTYQQIETEIDAATAEIRVAMTKKYQVEF